MLKFIKKIKDKLYLKRQSYRKSNSQRIVAIYAIFPKSPGEEVDLATFDIDSRTPITFTATMQEAIVAVDKICFLQHYDHYQRWCSLHHEDCGFATESWQKYKDVTETDPITEDKFVIIQLKQSTEDIAALCRLSSGCMPLQLKYERDFEVSHFVLQNYSPLDNSLTVPDEFSVLMKLDSGFDKTVRSITKVALKEYQDKIIDDALPE